MTIALRQRPLPQVVRQIVQRDNGAWLDPSDMSTMYQDAAGTIPVTAVEQPVGLMLDKSRGMMLGPELVSNGTFDTDVLWAKGPGWTISGGTALFSGATAGNLKQLALLTIGKKYKIEFDITITSQYIAFLPAYLSPQTAINSSGHKVVYLDATSTTFSIYAAPNAIVSIDNISIKELYGYHATQSITASRPTLSARYNLLTKTEDFSNAAWIKLNTTVSAAAYQSPIDGRLADKMVASTSLTSHEVQSAALTIPANTPYTFTARLKAAGKSWAALWFDGTNSGGAYFDLVNGVVGNTTFATSATISHLGSGEYLCSVTVSLPTASSISAAIYTCDDNGIYRFTGDGVVGTYCFYADLRLGTTSGPYQRVNTATDYDTDERYFKKYLRFDGVDDYLNLPYMGLYAGGACSIVAAMSENKVAYGTTLINETNGTLTAPMYNPTRQSDIGNNWRSLIRNDANVVTLSSTGALINADGHISVRSRIERESNTAAFENSINKESYNYARAGTLTLDKTTIGALLLGGVMGSPDNLNLYGLVITKSALTDSQRIACERYLGRKSGVQL